MYFLFKTQNRVSIITDGVYWIATHQKKELGFKPNWYYDCFFRQKVLFFLVNEKTKQKQKNQKKCHRRRWYSLRRNKYIWREESLGLHLLILKNWFSDEPLLPPSSVSSSLSAYDKTFLNKVQFTRKSPTKHRWNGAK